MGFKPFEDFIPLEVKQSRFYDELPKRLSDIAEGKVSPLQDNLLKVGNDALKLNIPPAKDCPKDKIFDMEQIVRYASNLYRRDDKDD